MAMPIPTAEIENEPVDFNAPPAKRLPTDPTPAEIATRAAAIRAARWTKPPSQAKSVRKIKPATIEDAMKEKARLKQVAAVRKSRRQRVAKNFR